MQRRTFFKALAGAVCGGVGALLARGHVRVVKTPLDFWDDPAEDVYGKNDGEPIATTYETVSLKADMAGNYEMMAGERSCGVWRGEECSCSTTPKGVKYWLHRPGWS